jgi:hypothetical protein
MDSKQNIAVGRPNPVVTRSSMEVQWNILERSYAMAYVRQCLEIEQRSDDDDFRADSTPHYHAMIVLGRFMEELEQMLRPLGWQPPRRSTVLSRD